MNNTDQRTAPAPSTVVWAVRLMYICAAIVVVAAVVNALLTPEYTAVPGSTPIPRTHQLIVLGIDAAVAALMWLSLTQFIRRGSNGARIFSAIIYVLTTINAVYTYIHTPTMFVRFSGLGDYPDILLWLLAAAALILIWHPRSSAFYSRPAKSSVA